MRGCPRRLRSAPRNCAWAPLISLSTVRLFADDCLLYRQIKSREDHISLQYDLQNLETWAKTWGMRFNAKKCYIMSINNKSTHFYLLDGHILQQVPENPYLGVTISEDLKWSSHISKISKKANSTLGFLKKKLETLPSKLQSQIKSREDHIPLQYDLQNLETWAKTWGMRLNAKKCYIMSINNKSTHFYLLDGHILQQVPENPYLGVTISEDLKWSSHISKITKKAKFTLGFLKKKLETLPSKLQNDSLHLTYSINT